MKEKDLMAVMGALIFKAQKDEEVRGVDDVCIAVYCGIAGLLRPRFELVSYLSLFDG